MSVNWKTQKSARIEDFTEQEIEERGIEIWTGEVVEVCKEAAGIYHNEFAMWLMVIFRQFCETNEGVWCAGDNDGFIVRRGPDSFLCPDAALFRLRMEEGPWHDFSPEIAVEIKSPRDSQPAILAKRDLYFDGGAEQVWMVYPEDKRLEIHFADGRLMEATGGVIECEGIAQGLKIDIDEYFKRPPFMKPEK